MSPSLIPFLPRRCPHILRTYACLLPPVGFEELICSEKRATVICRETGSRLLHCSAVDFDAFKPFVARWDIILFILVREEDVEISIIYVYDKND